MSAEGRSRARISPGAQRTEGSPVSAEGICSAKANPAAIDALATHRARFRRPPFVPDAPDGASPLWDAAAFDLDRVPAFRSAPARARDATLAACARNVLVEALSVEERGIAYCAAMAGRAETAEARALFLRIGADEAQHAAWLARWVEMPVAADPFIRFVDGLLAAGTPQPLAYLLQVVLEGFGITHYQSLARGCRDAALGRTLRRLALDEALHYGAGLLAFDATRMTAAERSFAVDGARAFAHMFRIGPQAVAAALAHEVGLHSLADATATFAALDCEASSVRKLTRLRTLMARPGMTWVVDELDAAGLFVPCTPAQCARQLLG